MIETMVAGLDERLRANPRDLEGWIRLVRSYHVLGRPDAARAAVKRASQALGEGSDEAKRIANFAARAGRERNRMTRKQKRLSVIAGALAFLGVASR